MCKFVIKLLTVCAILQLVACAHDPKIVKIVQTNTIQKHFILPIPVEKPVLVPQFIVFRPIYFDTNSSEIRESAEKQLTGLVALLTERQEITQLRIEGHADQRGTKKYNQLLSENRAESVSDFMELFGIDKRRLITVGMGETQPADYKSGEEAEQNNRRVEFYILKVK